MEEHHLGRCTRLYKNPKIAVDVVIFDRNRIVLIRRGKDPFKGRMAVPGGFVEYGETIEEAAMREALEETGLTVRLLEILGVYSAPDRDPRAHTISTAFVAESVNGDIIGGDDAEAAFWINLDEINPEELAFDHGMILADYRRWLKKETTFWSTKSR
jgi:8-oxo-dGTP diphosphatase